MTRDELAEKIRQRKEEAKTAGTIHYRDLMKNIKRLERELKTYDRYQAEARRCG